MGTKKNLPVSELYDSRHNFSIIGLTGLAGSGCSTMAEYMSSRVFLSDRKQIRNPEDIQIDKIKSDDNMTLYHEDSEKVNEKVIHQIVFKRKYEICYDFAQKNYSEYYVIKYTDVIWLYVLLFIKSQYATLGQDDIIWKLDEIFKDKFRPKRNQKDGYSSFDKDYFDNYNYIEEIKNISGIDWNGLERLLNEKITSYYSSENYRNMSSDLYSVFSSSIFKGFVLGITNYYKAKSYYQLCFLYHRLANAIRSTGSPITKSESLKTIKDTGHVFDLVKLVNLLIKARRHNDSEENKHGTRIVIDSIRNSLESMYLKERYSAYYLIAVHADADRGTRLKQKIKTNISRILYQQKEKEEFAKKELECIMRLSDSEADNSDYEKGCFFAPNVGQCIADAEIHISNPEIIETKPYTFFTMAEQWLKYSCLILHPGLITPSSEERCMVVAYTAKFNSTCLSRQVGACITNQYHSIRTIGWNEVPYGHIPCGLRDVRELRSLTEKIKPESLQYVYSEFERGRQEYNNHCSFIENVDLYLSSFSTQDYNNLEGLHYPYCFKQYHNNFEDKKNQVHTRSLHAEENAIMQMAKYGGEKLINGIIYVTASPCELCSKKLYQIGVRQIVYIDPYPGIARINIIGNGLKRPTLKLFQGAYGQTYYKLYQPFMPLKDEIKIRLNESEKWDKFNDIVKKSKQS